MEREAKISCLGEFNPRAVGARTCVTIDKYLLIDFGGVAQSDRARGSYPLGRWFKSTLRHQLFTKLVA